MIEVIPLGTGSALPSKERHYSATVVEHNHSLFLFDCGEGTQFQFLHAELRPTRIQAIFITHLHGDHYFGLPGLLSTLGLLGHEMKLTVVGPVGLRAFLDAIPSRMKAHETQVDLEIIEIDPNDEHTVVYENRTCQITSRPISHSVQTAGYRFQEKDRPGNLNVAYAKELGIHDFMEYRALKEGLAVTNDQGIRIEPKEVLGPTHRGVSFAYVTDTMPCEGGLRLAEHCDLLYHEATFTEEHQQRAVQTRHSTAKEAATIAKEAHAKHLLIGHFSGRYKDTSVLVEEARQVFKNTDAAEELKRYAIMDEVEHLKP